MFDFDSGEIININKPANLTSFQVVKIIRKKCQIKKIGHAGTLDPFATGVLIILTGKATKKSIELMSLEKEYLANIKLGKETDTDDIEGTIIKESFISESVPIGDIKTTINDFVGDIEQIPPKYSAIKHKGKPLYKYARKGIELELKPRKVFIEKIDLIEYNFPNLKISVTCSKGTYLRSLARDIGRKLNTYGYLESLRRTRIGTYKIENAFELDDFIKLADPFKT